MNRRSTIKKKLIYFTDTVAYGGAEEYLKILAMGVKSEFKTTVAMPKRDGTKELVEEIRDAGIDVDYIETSNTKPRQSLWNSFLYFLKERPDIVHFILTWPPFCRYPLLAARILNLRCFLTEQLVPKNYQLRKYDIFYKRLAYSAVKKAIAVSYENRQNLVSIFGLPEDKITVVHNGIDLSRFQNLDSNRLEKIGKELQIPEDALIITTIGRLHQQKGHEYLIKASKIVLSQFKDAIFLVVGEGELEDELQRMTNSLGLGDNFRHTGRRKEIPEILGLTDIFVLPSLFEGLPLVILEAMAAGKPVIASNISGIPEAVIDGATGILVPSQNEKELAGAILDLLTNSIKRKLMGENGKERASKYFSHKRMIEMTKRLYVDPSFSLR